MTKDHTPDTEPAQFKQDKPNQLHEDLRPRIVQIFLEHDTQYRGPYTHALESWMIWSCSCGLTEKLIIPGVDLRWDMCHVRTREHWADVIASLVDKL